MLSLEEKEIGLVKVFKENLGLEVKQPLLKTVLKDGKVLCIILKKSSVFQQISIPIQVCEKRDKESNLLNIASFINTVVAHPVLENEKFIDGTITEETILRPNLESYIALVDFLLSAYRDDSDQDQNTVHQTITTGQTPVKTPSEKQWCESCSQLIPPDHSSIKVFNKFFHNHCFKCVECHRIILIGEKFFEKTTYIKDPETGEEKIGRIDAMCIDCDGERLCSYCDNFISTMQDYSLINEDKFHSDCLQCLVCKRSLLQLQFVRVNNEFYCSDDYKKLQSELLNKRNNNEQDSPKVLTPPQKDEDRKCPSCKIFPEGQIINALGKQWHFDCFRCFYCKNRIVGNFYPSVVSPNTPEQVEIAVCTDCYKKNLSISCEVCGIIIESDYLIIGDGKYHSECLNCFRCKTIFDLHRSLNVKNKVNYCNGCC